MIDPRYAEMLKQPKYLVKDRESGKTYIAFESYAKKLDGNGFDIIAKEGEKDFVMVKKDKGNKKGKGK